MFGVMFNRVYLSGIAYGRVIRWSPSRFDAVTFEDPEDAAAVALKVGGHVVELEGGSGS